MEKIAFVLSGGGSRGAYEFGALKCLYEHGIKPDIVVGTSIGAVNGAMVTQGDIEVAGQCWNEISTETIVGTAFKNAVEKTEYIGNIAKFAGSVIKSNVANAEKMDVILRKFISEEKIRNSPIEFGVVVTALPGFGAKEVFVDEMAEGEVIDYIIASASCYPVFGPRKIGDKTYIDGGYFNNFPINMAVRRGATKIYAINLFPESSKSDFSRDGVEITLIETMWNTGVFFLFETETVKSAMTLGYLDCLKVLGELGGRLYAFEKGELENFYPHFQNRLKALQEKIGFASYFSSHANFGMTSVDAFLLGFYKNIYGKEQDMFMAAIENAGKVFNLSPLRSRTVQQYNLALWKRYKAASHAAVTVFGKIKTPGDGYKIADKLISSPRRPGSDLLVVFLVMLIRRSIESEKSKRRLWTLATLFPKEYAAAVYLCCITEAKE